ncbi:hypothetical protein NQZ68_022573 [Dissostichus eleginoides]|nr:hypothetical protein NQZ68_022573 [Dissostichus eleginoides]
MSASAFLSDSRRAKASVNSLWIAAASLGSEGVETLSSGRALVPPCGQKLMALSFHILCGTKWGAAMPPTEEPPVIMNNSGFRGCRTISQHLNDLKKENFSLKLRIYFLEEKIQQKFEESGDDVHKRNIMLKVEVESLKKELEEKQQFLDQALLTAESLSNQNEAELQRRLEDRQEEIIHMQEILETKVQLLQEEAELARGEAERMTSLADSESQRRLAVERELVERMEEEEEGGGSGGQLSQQALADKDRLIEELTQQKHSLSLQLEELQVKVHHLSSPAKSKERAVSHGESRVCTQMQRPCRVTNVDKVRAMKSTHTGKQITCENSCINNTSTLLR